MDANSFHLIIFILNNRINLIIRFYYLLFQNISSVSQGEQLFNILSIQEGAAGLELPEWTKKVYPDQLKALAQRNLAVLTETDFMKRIKGGTN